MGTVRAAWSDASDGDLRPASPLPSADHALARWASRIPGEPAPVQAVLWMEQVHGSVVLVGESPTGHRSSASDRIPVVRAGTGDAMVTGVPELGLAVLTADCASVALGSPEGIVGAVHAGWRGLVVGVIQEAADRLRDQGASQVFGALGPCIHAECYEFSESDLRRVAAALGDGVRSRTADGRPALDVPEAVAAALTAGGVTQVAGVEACTACGPGYFSHRARQDSGRQALVAWSSGPEGR